MGFRDVRAGSLTTTAVIVLTTTTMVRRTLPAKIVSVIVSSSTQPSQHSTPTIKTTWSLSSKSPSPSSSPRLQVSPLPSSLLARLLLAPAASEPSSLPSDLLHQHKHDHHHHRIKVITTIMITIIIVSSSTTTLNKMPAAAVESNRSVGPGP